MPTYTSHSGVLETLDRKSEMKILDTALEAAQTSAIAANTALGIADYVTTQTDLTAALASLVTAVAASAALLADWGITIS